jgi:hypothetical protein
MVVVNCTSLSITTALKESVVSFPTDGLLVEIKYSRRGTRRFISGTYYRRTPDRESGRLIRIRINRANCYPVTVSFKTSEYFTNRDARGRTLIYQRLRSEKFYTPEDLVLAIFLHEFSHYLDHIEGRNGRYKQTKADKFAIAQLERLGVIEARVPS